MSPTLRPPSTWRARTIWLAPNISSATRPSLRWRGRSVYLAAQAECCCERQKSRKAIICRQRESERESDMACSPSFHNWHSWRFAGGGRADEGGIFYVIVKRTTPLYKKIAKGIRILFGRVPSQFLTVRRRQIQWQNDEKDESWIWISSYKLRMDQWTRKFRGSRLYFETNGSPLINISIRSVLVCKCWTVISRRTSKLRVELLSLRIGCGINVVRWWWWRSCIWRGHWGVIWCCVHVASDRSGCWIDVVWCYTRRTIRN